MITFVALAGKAPRCVAACGVRVARFVSALVDVHALEAVATVTDVALALERSGVVDAVPVRVARIHQALVDVGAVEPVAVVAAQTPAPVLSVRVDAPGVLRTGMRARSALIQIRTPNAVALESGDALAPEGSDDVGAGGVVVARISQTLVHVGALVAVAHQPAIAGARVRAVVVGAGAVHVARRLVALVDVRAGRTVSLVPLVAITLVRAHIVGTDAVEVARVPQALVLIDAHLVALRQESRHACAVVRTWQVGARLVGEAGVVQALVHVLTAEPVAQVAVQACALERADVVDADGVQVAWVVVLTLVHVITSDAVALPTFERGKIIYANSM